ncbi:hypothetical protein Q4610_02165 [Sphingobium sp. HBC34]|uniref:Uncharacterized protein n=1 Tax=Sphingobium cyanobacteriorum TaxID=3063954 RepID=A0ABT8ZH18_9SPHN|nr:hypothetical protein [Sphingobium sp. HBC34]MDO7833839.1 hypothetical protein [Sphingobium sp. HBC34]
MKKICTAAVMAAIALTANLSVVSVANAGEGHWSIGKGIQCRLVGFRVVCGKTRP